MRRQRDRSGVMIEKAYSFARATVLVSLLGGCAAGLVQKEAQQPPRQATASAGLLQRGIRHAEVCSGDVVHAVLLSDGEELRGVLNLRATRVDDAGVDFEFALAMFDGRMSRSDFRVNYDDSRSGDLSALEFFGGMEFYVLRSGKGAIVVYRDTIAQGLRTNLRPPACPSSMEPGLACT